ncbi:hypothetical protein, partial [Nitrospirillum viridazoti]|uniref:hypothetical protein n=1 Tax=Nitrospirillum viridazoti TaxID=3144925 RepID=UPI001FCB0D95
ASARHTRRVNQAKVVLPTLAGLTIAAIALWPLIKETTNPAPPIPAPASWKCWTPISWERTRPTGPWKYVPTEPCRKAIRTT